MARVILSNDPSKIHQLRSVMDPFRSNKRNPEPATVQGCLSIKEALSKERVGIG